MLKSEQDAFGQALWAYQNGEIDACAVTERDDGYVNAVPASFYFSKFEDWPEIEQKALDHQKGTRIQAIPQRDADSDSSQRVDRRPDFPRNHRNGRCLYRLCYR